MPGGISLRRWYVKVQDNVRRSPANGNPPRAAVTPAQSSRSC